LRFTGSRRLKIPKFATQSQGIRDTAATAAHGRAVEPVLAGLPRITVADVLELPVIRQGLPDVVAGRRHLDRPIRWVHAGEVPNIASLLSGGELLLTTGMGIGRRPAEQRRFLAQLAQTGIAALIIELGGAVAEIAPALRQAAEEHGLPLIALRREVPFVAVTEAIHTELVNARYEVLRQGEEIHRRLIGLLLADEGIPEVLESLAATLHNPVFLEGGEGRLLYHAAAGTGGADPLSVWESMRAEPDRDGEHGVLAVRIPMGPEQRCGRLVAFEADSPFDVYADVAMDRAADLVALALQRARQEEELLARERGNFLADLSEGRITPDEAERHAQCLGLTFAPRLLLPVAAEVRAAANLEAAAWHAVLGDTERRLRDQTVAVLLGTSRQGGLLAIVGLRRAEQRRDAAQLTAEAIRDAVNRRLGAADVAVAVGGAADWAGIGTALRLAVDGAASALALPPAAWHDVHALELERLLWRWRNDEELGAFVERTLGRLLEHDRRRKLHLLPTLEALLANGGRKAETARALHLNRQALYGRLTRIQELLDLDLEQADQRLILHMALCARRHVPTEPPSRRVDQLAS
jgi:PucR family transcriptional regulator, purine catabolism regulatory protein